MKPQCNPAKAGVLTPVQEKIVVQKRAQDAAREARKQGGGDPIRQMSTFGYYLSGFFGLNNLSTAYPILRPYVKALELGEEIRSTLNMEYSSLTRKVGALNSKDVRSMTRLMEVEDAEGRLATENKDGTATITTTKDHVGSKKGETITLSKELNDTRKEMRGAFDTIYSHMITSIKTAMGYGAQDKVSPKDQKVLDLLEKVRKEGYLPHIRMGSWGVEYTLGGTTHFESFGWDPGAGVRMSAKARAEDRIQELQKMGATNISPPLDMVGRRELLDRYLPQASTLTKIDILLQTIMVPGKGNSYNDVSKVLDSLRREAAAPQSRLRQRKDVPGWLTKDNYDTYLRSVFAPFIFNTSDWIANKATENLRSNAISDVIATKDTNLSRIVQNQEEYLHSNESVVARLKSAAFLYTLGFNMSSALVNLTQAMHTTVPFLGGMGGAGNAVREVTKAYADLFPGARGALIGSLDPEKIFNIDKMKISAEEKAILREMYKRGVAEAVLTRDQVPAYAAQSQSKGVYAAGQAMGKVLDASAIAFTAIEQMNRLATALAAHRMYKDKTTQSSFKKFGAAIGREINNSTDAAELAIRETQFVTSKPFRARYMQGTVLGLASQFSAFPIYMLGFLNRAARYYGGDGIFKSPEGRKTLGLFTLGIFATSGLWGLPFAGPGGDALDWLTKQFGPALGMSPTATRAFLRETLQDAFKAMPSLNFMGTPAELAEMVMYGPFRATGVDISGRTALDIIQFNPFQFDIFNLGPLGGAVAGGVRDAVNYASKGEDMMAAASLMPIAFRNIARAKVAPEIGYITPGKLETTLPAEKIGPADVAKLTLGFRPTEVSRAAERKEEAKTIADRMEGARTSYSDKIATNLARAQITKDPEDKRQYLQEVQRLRREISSYDKGRPLRDKIVPDYTSFESTIQRKVKSIRMPERAEAVPTVARPYYTSQQREFKQTP